MKKILGIGLILGFGGALCLNSAGAMAKCTSAIDASGNCTCP